MIVKRFGTDVFLGNLGFSLKKVHYSFKKLDFSLENNHIPMEKEFKLP
jgi:transcriptional antiterminator